MVVLFLPPAAIYFSIVISINIYQPGKINADIHFPAEWNDLEESELHFIARILLNRDDATDDETRPQILKFILENRVKKAKIKVPDHFFTLFNPEDLVIQCLSLLNFIFDKSDRTNLPKEITLRFRKYFPQPFTEMTCAEFEDCEVITNQFAEKPEAETLAHLAAILFRPRSGRFSDLNDKIVPYIKYRAADDTYLIYQSEQKIKLFSKLKPEVLYSVLIWYAGSRSELPKYFPELYNGKSGGKANPNVFTDTIHAGAGPKNGTRNQIRATKLYEFLYDCNQEAIKAAELQAEYDKINK